MDLVVTFVDGDRSGQPGLLALGEVLATTAQDGPDPVQGVPGPAAVPEGLLLHPAPHLVHGMAAELDDVEGVISVLRRTKRVS